MDYLITVKHYSSPYMLLFYVTRKGLMEIMIHVSSVVHNWVTQMYLSIYFCCSDTSVLLCICGIDHCIFQSFYSGMLYCTRDDCHRNVFIVS